jgi:hypothetical protein
LFGPASFLPGAVKCCPLPPACFGQTERAKREECERELDQLKAQSATFRDELQNLRLQLKAAERCSASSTALEIRLLPTSVCIIVCLFSLGL